MGTVNMEVDGPEEQSIDPFSFARRYQLEALEKAINENTIVFLETGAGKTLIAIMLLRTYAFQIRKPSARLAIFLVPHVVLVRQQAEAINKLTDLKVGMYWGDMGIDYWDATKWKEEQAKHEVLVMTPAILLNGLRHCFFKLEQIELLVFDECHHAIGKDPYACIMKEFYHNELQSNQFQLPRILGLTGSLVNSKGSNTSLGYWQKIDKLETILHSKVYACGGESVLSQYIPSSTTRVVLYEHKDIPCNILEHFTNKLKTLKEMHESSLAKLELSEHSEESARKKLSKLLATFLFCLSDFGLWMTLKAAESSCSNDTDIFLWGNLDLFGETIIKKFSNDVAELLSSHVPSVPECSIGDNLQVLADGLLTTKVSCLVNCLLEYRGSDNLRCIIFVERVVTSIVLNKFLTEVLPKYNGWKCEYIAGNSSRLQSQSRKLQNQIVEAFREGKVNVIVATSVLEEGLDVQSCNVVIRFDPSPNVCSFIQSRGRARKEKSDFLIMVRSGDWNTISCVKNYLQCGDLMREESLRHASFACKPLEMDSYSHMMYRVESTGAIVNLNSSISLIYYYCSRLPSDGYFKPTPRFKIDKEPGICTLYLPKSCPLASISVQSDASIVKKVACLEACKKLHEMGELADNLVPRIVLEETVLQQTGNDSYDIRQPLYFPHELVGRNPYSSHMMFYCYLIELQPGYTCDIEVHNFVLATTNEFDSDIFGMDDINLQVDRGTLAVRMKYAGVFYLSSEQVLTCRKFQSFLFRILLDHNLNKVGKMTTVESGNEYTADYLLLPTFSKMDQNNVVVDWSTVTSAFISCKRGLNDHTICFPPENRGRVVQTNTDMVCSCMLQSAIVCTPHNNRLYHVSGFLDNLDGNSLLLKRDGTKESYKEYFESRHGIVLQHEREGLLKGRSIFPVPNYLQSCRLVKTKESSGRSVELPPELCHIIMSPISISTLYSFSLAPSILHRLESLLIASNLKKLHLKRNLQNIDIPTSKVLEAITTKKCQEAFHLESLEALGDSFLKYATCQHLFKTYRSQHEGLLSIKKDSIISNASLCRLGCERKLPGFIRNEFFDPQYWIVPGDQSSGIKLEETEISSTKFYIGQMRTVKSKTVADVVEALIGAYLSTAGEPGAILFLDWLGIPLDFVKSPYERKLQIQPERLVNVKWLESLLNYSFRDRSLLVEALTHGSYMLPELPTCYQRLEFLGDAVLDYVITLHLYNKYPGMQPGLLTDLRSASVNNDCYAQSAIRASLHKHLLHASQMLHKHIIMATSLTDASSLTSTFGWESETPYPKVLGDIIESLAGAILVDSGYNKETVFNSIRPLLEPLITPETVCYHPVRELNQLCQKKHFHRHKSEVSCQDGKASVTVKVEANSILYKHKAVSADKKTAKKVASMEVLKALKAAIPGL